MQELTKPTKWIIQVQRANKHVIKKNKPLFNFITNPITHFNFTNLNHEKVKLCLHIFFIAICKYA